MRSPATGALERDVAAVADERALVARSVAGDLTAYSELVGGYQFHALRVAAAIAGPASAEDAVQDALIRAFSALPRFDPAKPFRPWLLTIVANTARNQRRSARRWEHSVTTVGRVHLASASASAGTADTTSPEEAVVQRDADDQLLAAVARLPRAQRTVIACRYLMDLTEEETATVLGIPRGTVKSRLARGLSRLEKALREDQELHQPPGGDSA
jgi:RNA polymerase sigma-70 factor (ECF subfamily)